ncbi:MULTISPECIES: SAV_6107 family HEPN domain-containing protein [unclassified Actinotalea]|uniref:SAV_6107 family HEPN domain-containing protein n=1 Tax=unclassified Actinotalea TaxID=2638618 RepID=UPI0015F708DD|nr:MULTISPECIES: SAV_6107 family HEPN domain-containing protein [unclassified Actinotalea]
MTTTTSTAGAATRRLRVGAGDGGPRVLRAVEGAQGTERPVPPSAVELLARSDAELTAAQLAGSEEERFLHAHLAALRAGAALLEVTGRPRRRPVPRTVWDMVAAVAPDLSPWTTFFAGGAPVRAALESGREHEVGAEQAERTVAAAEDFQDAVRRTLGADAASQGRLVLHAS